MQHLLVLMQIVHVVTSGVSECDMYLLYDLKSVIQSVMKQSVFSYFNSMLFIFYLFIFSFKIGAHGGAVC
jgi:hypothetical protein